jgi:hypothetical protein
MSTVREQMDAAYAKMRAGESEIEYLRENCPHPGRKMIDYMWRPGTVRVQALCVDCDKVLGDPTAEERAGFVSILDPSWCGRAVAD